MWQGGRKMAQSRGEGKGGIRRGGRRRSHSGVGVRGGGRCLGAKRGLPLTVPCREPIILWSRERSGKASREARVLAIF
jgi:hypothetical protein